MICRSDGDEYNAFWFEIKNVTELKITVIIQFENEFLTLLICFS